MIMHMLLRRGVGDTTAYTILWTAGGAVSTG